MSEVARIERWLREYLRIPTGHGAGGPFVVAPFQRHLLEVIVDSLATLISISAGNGKTSFMAAVGLERLARGDDYAEVDVIATKEEQAQRVLESAIQLVECSPVLAESELFDFQVARSELVYRPTGSRMRAHPAKLSAVQGLNFSLALVDEIGFVPAELVNALIARLGKREDARVVGFGTPGFEPDNMLELLRAQSHAGELPPGVKFVEYMAEPGCAVDDRAQWVRANPAIEAGFLREEALEVQAALMVASGREHEFRAYHLGQPIEASGPWLPYGAWDSCVQAEPPRDGAPVVLGLWGNYKRQVAICGASLDGAVFFGWQADKPSDGEVEQAVRLAAEQWDVQGLVHKPHIRLGLMERLLEDGLPVEPWPQDRKTDADSTAALYQAVAEQQIAHDHDATLTEQMARLTAKVDNKGVARLVESEDDVAAALAMRAAWWRARALAGELVTNDHWRIF